MVCVSEPGKMGEEDVCQNMCVYLFVCVVSPVAVIHHVPHQDNDQIVSTCH